MNLDKASQIIVIACLMGFVIMAAYINIEEDWIILTLLAPVALMIYAKKVNKKELEND